MNEPIVWTGCYESSWKGLITDKSFAHPAKFARGLIERIYDHCLAKGYLKRGDTVGDCFGGIGTGGITAAYRGLNWVGCELEPRFVEMAQENFRLHRHGWSAVRGGEARIVEGDSRKFDEAVAAIVSSPPYADTEITLGQRSGCFGDPVNMKEHTERRQEIGRQYGKVNGQIGSLKSGAVDSVITSPPFTQGYQGGGGINKNGYTSRPDLGTDWIGKRTYQGQGGDRAQGNIETLKEGTVDACISSPPYSDIAAGAGGLNTKPATNPGQQSGRNAESASQDTDQRYGISPGQISQLKGGSVDACVSSPPYEGTRFDGGEESLKQKQGFHKGYSAEGGYGDNTEGQIGKENGETYWSAVKLVYEACFRSIRPGGVIVLVVKDYVSKKKRVRLCDDTCKLLEHVGFTPLERVHAMVVTETTEDGLFGEEKTKRQRKSFFRRIYEEKLPEGDDRRIDWEEVLIYRRP